MTTTKKMFQLYSCITMNQFEDDSIPYEDADIAPYSFCTKCERMVVHPIGDLPPENHQTCICFALQFDAICCVQGYRNLMEALPALLHLFSMIPNKLNLDCFLAWQKRTNVISISRRRYEKIKNECMDYVSEAYSDGPLPAVLMCFVDPERDTLLEYKF